MRLLLALSVAAVTLAGCPSRQPVQCGSDADCDFAGGGTCAASSGGLGWCAYPAGDCPSGYRYATDTGAGLAGICVEDDAGIDAGIDGSSNDVTPPTIAARSPGMNAAAVARNASVSVMFSEPIAPSTVTASSFEVKVGDVLVAGQLSASGSSATFTPSVVFAPTTQYTVTVGTAVTDLAGNPLASSSSWSFTTGTATWGPPVLVETEMNMKASDLRVASGGSIVVAAWLMASCTGSQCQPASQLWYSVRQGGTWSPGAPVGGVLGSISDLALVVDSMDRATVVFPQTIGAAATTIYAAHYAAGSWTNPIAIEPVAQRFSTSPSAAVDASGHVFAAWVHFDPTRPNAMVNRYVPGTGWGTATLIEHTDMSVNGRPSVAASTTDAAFAVWPQGGSIMGARYSAGSWAMETDGGRGLNSPRVVMHTDGSAVAVWTDSGGASSNRNTGAWGGAQAIDGLDAPGIEPIALAMTMGNAIAVWVQQGDLWQARFEPGPGWGSAFRLETGGGMALYPTLALAPDGSGLATWEQPSPAASSAAWANLLVPGIGWGAAQLIKPDDGVNAQRPNAFFDVTAGTFGAVWLAAPSGYPSVYAATLQ